MEQMVLNSQVYPYPTQTGISQCITVTHTDESSSKPAVIKRRRKRKSNNKASSVSDDVAVNMLMRKRKLTDEQVNMLEYSFSNEHKLESGRKEKIANELGLDPRQVAVWFQNRRARWKNKKLEEEYAKLKNHHDSVVLGQCQFESQVLNLTARLSEAQNEIRRLSERLEEMSCNNNNSSCSLVSIEANNAPIDNFEFDLEAYNNMPDYMLDNYYLQNIVDWNGVDWNGLYV